MSLEVILFTYLEHVVSFANRSRQVRSTLYLGQM